MLVDDLKRGLDAPICLTWELTYACNLACVHCLSSSGRRDPRELSTAEAKAVIDELRDLQVFYVNIGGGEPTIRRDFFEIVEYAIERGVGVKFSTNGTRIDAATARRLAAMDYLDVQISIDGADAATNDAVRGEGSFAMARARHGQPGRRRLRALQDQPRRDPPQRRPARRVRGHGRRRTAPSCASRACGRRVAAPTPGTSCTPPTTSSAPSTTGCMDRPHVLTGDSFFHLSALGEPLPGLNLCGAGRVVCLIDPVGDVYACPFVIHDEFQAGSVRDTGGFTGVWRGSELFTRAARAAVGRRLRVVRRATTPARAAAWRPSSSPACRSTAPTPSA